MLDGTTVRRILFVQQPGVLPQQRDEVEQKLAQALPGCRVDFVSRPEDLVKTAGYDAVITPTLPWLSELLQRVEDTPWIHFLSSGVDRILRNAEDFISGRPLSNAVRLKDGY